MKTVGGVVTGTRTAKAGRWGQSMILAAGNHDHIPSLVWVSPFAVLLLCVAVLPLLQKTEHWWHKNKNK
ncbi:MAG: sodium:proton antiporter, partial [Planctomycetota bacterium]|nr:sodium:proton antiporter [Planctomycetota bacterium]